MALQGNGPHDVGGRVDLLGIPLQQDEEDSGWGTECHALFVALTKKSILSTDELRRGVEGLSEEAHATWGYYARWIAAITGLLQEKDVISPGSLEAQLAGDAVERREQDGRPAAELLQQQQVLLQRLPQQGRRRRRRRNKQRCILSI